MGELVDLAAYKKQKEEKEEIERQKREAAEMEAAIEEAEMLKRVLAEILQDLPDVQTSIMYVPIEPKMDAFMHKDDFDIATDLDGYLTKLGLKYSEDDDREDT
tara:strand:+ start:252 stop:560 length:309 start_codon:yes stop_codon:yes gene_type:complete